ncbi:slo-interacting protein 1-like isoform X1 [Hermetia illucens]|uniref:slo-interacting protein 1-like isoform X1 n=2 Tax=Hermetia illucens TaxID=343691 RepID=UPI0018CC79E9|nr:slo-interacting protein 1-like isoform X1 [Hermetia illucens]
MSSAGLNFIVLKINDIDVTGLSHEEIIQIFLKTEDPIIVKVRRRRAEDGTDKLSLFDRYQQQTKTMSGCKIANNVECQANFPICNLIEHHHTAITNSSNNTECCHRLIDSQTIFAHCLAPEIDIEEVTLRKSRSDEKLGLTVSYSSVNGSTSISASDEDEPDSDNIIGDQEEENVNENNDDNTCGDIYICDILPDSIAARDGRLRQGDQIIQINGKDILNKDETQSLFAENKNSITLLVSRCVYTDDEFLDSAIYCDEKDQNTGLSLSIDCEPSIYSSKSSLHSLTEQQQKQSSLHSLPEQQKQSTTLQTITTLDTNTCDHANIRAQLESVNKEISLLNSQISNIKFQKDSTQQPPHSPQPLVSSVPGSSLRIIPSLTQTSTICSTKPSKIPSTSPINQKSNSTNETPPSATSNVKKSLANSNDQPVHLQKPPLSAQHVTTSSNVASITQQPSNKTGQFMEIEHIYETIPEDSETDSYYCSPYDERKDQSRIEQWLKSQNVSDSSGIGGDVSNKPAISPAMTGSLCPQQPQITILNNSGTKKEFNLNQTALTRMYRNNSSGDDYENSSSAYNTGDSCTSNQLTFELKGDDKNKSSSTLVSRPYSRQIEAFDNCKQCQQLRCRKEKPSTKGGAKKFSNRAEVKMNSEFDLTTRLHQEQYQMQSRGSSSSYKNSVTGETSKTIKGQNKLLRRAVAHNQQKISEITSTNYLSPSSSQYQVFRGTTNSSIETSGQQQLSSQVQPLTISCETTSETAKFPEDDSTTMVWKVKRRTDGSRYIVRRPIRRASTSSSTNQYQQYSHHQEIRHNPEQDQILCSATGGGIVIQDEIITITEASSKSSSHYRHLSNKQSEGRLSRPQNSEINTKERKQTTTIQTHQQKQHQQQHEPVFSTSCSRNGSSRHIQKQWVI